jgi:hypothetical protein
MNDLNRGTTYYVRAYATNSIGTGYGMTMSFTTLGFKPSANSLTSTSITTVSATLKGNC